jgi:hypothetical protein
MLHETAATAFLDFSPSAAYASSSLVRSVLTCDRWCYHACRGQRSLFLGVSCIALPGLRLMQRTESALLCSQASTSGRNWHKCGSPTP